MTEARPCSGCGVPLRGGGADGMCPRCLLRLGLCGGDDQEAGAAEGGWEARKEVPGTRVGRYRLVEEIGEGGFAIVWLAEQLEPVQRRVALKILKPGMDSREVVARFETERQTLALMDHPNIARVYDGGCTELGRPYFVMELVAGLPLTRYCDQAGIGTRRRLALMLDTLAAVQHAHQKGIIHRDLKPSNIMVSDQDGKPVVKVIDFGIAKALEPGRTGRTAVTGRDRMIGTPEYMSPEQAASGSLDVDTRSDVYALGGVLYELLTGRTPHDFSDPGTGGDAAICRTLCEVEPPRPSTRLAGDDPDLTKIARRRGTNPARLCRQVRGDLDWIVMKALEKDRARRYPSASGMALDLQRFLDHEPVLARPPGVAYRFGRFASRNKPALALACLLALTLVAATAFSVWEALLAKRARAVALERLRQASVSEARALRMSGQAGRRFGALKSLRTAAGIRSGPDLRDEATPILGVADLQPAEEWPSNAAITDMAALAADFSCHAVSGPDGTVRVFSEPPDVRLLATLAGDGVPVSGVLRFSPDGRWLAVGHAQSDADRVEVAIWDWREARRLALIGQVSRGALDFTPDGRRVVADAEGGLLVADATTGRRIALWPGVTEPSETLRVSPDGRTAALSSLAAQSVKVIELTGGLTLGKGGFVKPRGLDWHRDGRRLAVACVGGVAVWDTRHADHMTFIAAAPGAVIDRVAWSHGTELLASSGWHQPVTLYDGSLGETLVSANGDVKDLRFSPDDSRLGLVWNEGSFGLLETADGHLARHADGSGEEVRAAAWEPGGGVLATVSESRLCFWNREMRAIGARDLVRGRFAAFASGALVVVADTVRRYPYQLAGEPPVLRLGKEEMLDAGTAWHAGSVSADGRWLAVAGRGHAALFDLAQRGMRREIGAHPGADQAVLSPDARWLATAAFEGPGVRVWNVATGRLAAEFPDYRRSRVSFSAKGDRLVVATGGGYHFHRSGAWELAHELPCRMGADLGWLVWSPRDTVFAAEPEDYALSIYDAHSMVLLTSPQFERQRPLGFNPDGSLLLTTDNRHRVHQWDLALIRVELDRLDTDVEFDPLPPSNAPLVEEVADE